jgi:hypothetical protein
MYFGTPSKEFETPLMGFRTLLKEFETPLMGLINVVKVVNNHF